MNNLSKNYFDYIIIGAGPAGVQLGYFMEKHNLNYCILEKSSSVGSFFEKYPRQRRLISINKIFTGYDDLEINLRWDWNSLLCDEPKLLFKNYSKKFFPHPDDFIRYLKDFAAHYELNIKYNSEVDNISKDNHENFIIQSNTVTYRSKFLIVATGIPKQRIPEIEGIELCELYENCSVDPNDYLDQKVLIIGKGNSGFETADNLVSTASRIHLLSPNIVKFAWKTHYVGDLRALNNNHLDTYLLKSQNAVLNAEIIKIRKDEDGQYHVLVNYTKVSGIEHEELSYDRVIIASGFTMNLSFFDKSIKPQSAHDGKFPRLTCEWESTNVKNLYFAGVLSHSRDYKKATSGFIHGYRYNCKALIQMLLRKNYEIDLPVHKLKTICLSKIHKLVLNKINRSSALWQQFGFFGDVLIIEVQENKAYYLEALPCDYIHEILCKEREEYHLFTLEYGTRHFDPFSNEVQRVNRFDMENAHESDFLHPVIRKYSRGKLISEKHLLEDLDGEFLRKEHIDALHEYFKTNMAMNHTSPKKKSIRIE